MGKNSLIVVLVVLFSLVFVPSVLGVCTLTLDKVSYAPLETASDTFLVGSGPVSADGSVGGIDPVIIDDDNKTVDVPVVGGVFSDKKEINLLVWGLVLGFGIILLIVGALLVVRYTIKDKSVSIE